MVLEPGFAGWQARSRNENAAPDLARPRIRGLVKLSQTLQAVIRSNQPTHCGCNREGNISPPGGLGPAPPRNSASRCLGALQVTGQAHSTKLLLVNLDHAMGLLPIHREFLSRSALRQRTTTSARLGPGQVWTKPAKTPSEQIVSCAGCIAAGNTHTHAGLVGLGGLLRYCLRLVRYQEMGVRVTLQCFSCRSLMLSCHVQFCWVAQELDGGIWAPFQVLHS